MTTGVTGPTGTDAPMLTFYIKSRRTSPFLFDTVTATSREAAVDQVAKAIPEGEQIEILEVKDITEMAGADGPTGATGATGAATRK
jgi:hypothetical protein